MLLYVIVAAIAIAVLLPVGFFLMFPSCFLRFFLFAARLLAVRVRVDFGDRIPRTGGALLTVNHVSVLDAVWLLAATPRRIRYMAHQSFFAIAPLRWLFRRLGVIMVPASGHPHAMRVFLGHVAACLEAGELVCIFPEGGVSDSGYLRSFRTGMSEMMPASGPVPVIPVRLGMIWGRLFSMDGTRIRFTPVWRWPIQILIRVGEPVPPEIDGFVLRQLISQLGAEAEMSTPFYHEYTIHESFVRLTHRHPFKKVYSDSDGKGLRNLSMLARVLIFAELIKRADADNSGKYVGVLLPNSTAHAAALLGCGVAGRVPAILNYTASADARRLACEKASLKTILTSRKFVEKLKMPVVPEMVFLEDLVPTVTCGMKLRAFLRTLLPTALILRNAPKTGLFDTAVLLFSSGSTGIPKGVMLSHHNIISNIMSFWRLINWNRSDKVIGNLPLFHAYGFMVCFAFPAVSGSGVVYLMNPLDGSHACRLIAEKKITMMMGTPAFLQTYLRKAQPGQFRSLRLVIAGAEKMRRDIAEDYRKATGLALIEGFGCTELSPIAAINLSSSFYRFGMEAGPEGSIGAAVPGTHIKIVDPESFEEVKPGTPGLMLVKGGNVMQGYLGDPEATAAVIRDGFYNTGDIATMSEDGYITITGRASRFSKIGGEMVPHELVEQAINETIRSCGRVIAVCGREDPKRGEKLVVFYSQPEFKPDEVIKSLRERGLPNLWIPKADDFHFIENLPLLGSGKLDLQKLKELVKTIPQN